MMLAAIDKAIMAFGPIEEFIVERLEKLIREFFWSSQ
jgi:hypothetical protein